MVITNRTRAFFMGIVTFFGAVDRLSAQRRILGSVSDMESSRPLPGAVVELCGHDASQLSTSDSAGRYLFTQLSPGTYELRAMHPAYERRTLWVVVGPRADISVDLLLTRSTQRSPVPLERVVVRALLPRDDRRAALDSALDDRAPWRTLASTTDARPSMYGSLSDASALSPAARDSPGAGFSPRARALIARVGAELPAGSGALWASARRINSGLTGRWTGRPFDYSYADAFARAEFPAEQDTIGATLIMTTEGVRIPRDQTVVDASWRNLAGALGWARGSGARRRSARVTLGRGAVELPLLSLAAGRGLTTADRATLTVDDTRWGKGWSEAHGAELDLFRLGEQTDGVFGASGGAVPGPTSSSSMNPPTADVAVCAARVGCWVATSTRGSVFAEWSHVIAPRVSAGAGARVSAGGNNGSVSFSALPRASFQVKTGRNIVIGASIGRYSQVIATSGVMRDATPTLAPVHGLQSEVGASWRGANASLSAVASSSRVQQTPRSATTTSARGADVAWQWSVARVSTAVTYSALLTGATTQFSRARHVAAGRVTVPAGGLRVELAATYAVGLPYTSVVLDRPFSIDPVSGGVDSVAAHPSRPLVRADATIRGRWNVTVAGRSVTLEPEAMLRNMLGRDDAAFYYRSGTDPSRVRALAALPMIASVGLRWDARLRRESKR